jgi:hypothetical protein
MGMDTKASPKVIVEALVEKYSTSLLDAALKGKDSAPGKKKV